MSMKSRTAKVAIALFVFVVATQCMHSANAYIPDCEQVCKEITHFTAGEECVELHDRSCQVCANHPACVKIDDMSMACVYDNGNNLLSVYEGCVVICICTASNYCETRDTPAEDIKNVYAQVQFLCR